MSLYKNKYIRKLNLKIYWNHDLLLKEHYPNQRCEQSEYGSFFPNVDVIYLNNKHKEIKQNEVLAHEIGHWLGHYKRSNSLARTNHAEQEIVASITGLCILKQLKYHKAARYLKAHLEIDDLPRLGYLRVDYRDIRLEAIKLEVKANLEWFYKLTGLYVKFEEEI